MNKILVFFNILLVGAVVSLGLMANNFSNEVDGLSAENSSLSSQLEHEEDCHVAANLLAVEAEQLMVDLYQYGDDDVFYNDIQEWVDQSVGYNESCIDNNEVI